MGGVVKNKQGGIKYDVFDDDGNFRGSFYHGEPIRQIKNNMAYIVSEDAEGCPMIKQYEIHFERGIARWVRSLSSPNLSINIKQGCVVW